MDGSPNPLTPEQRELLSAWTDGEIVEGVRAQMDALLQRADAQAYVKQLRAMRALVARHGAAAAPRALKGSVLSALIEQPARGKLIAVPMATWRTAIMALAAMLVVGLALFFAPALLEVRKVPTGVARSDGADPQAGKPTTDGLLSDSIESRPAEFEGLKDGGKAEARGSRSLEKREDSKEENGENLPPPVPGAGELQRMAAPPAPPAAESPAGADKPKGEGPLDDKAAPDEAARRDRAAEARDDDLEKSGNSAKAERETEKMGSARAQGGAGAGDVVFVLRTRHGLAAQNDLMRVGALYGRATLGELPDDGMEDVLVDVDEERVPQLVAALKLLARQQEYGALRAPEGFAGPNDAKRAETDNARAEQPEEARKSDGAPAPRAARAAGRKVRLKVRLE